jgi:hypothetical protein
MTTAYTKLSLEIAEVIFERIEKDRSLIKQSIAEVIERELKLNFGCQANVTSGGERSSSPAPLHPGEGGGGEKTRTMTDIMRKAYQDMMAAPAQRAEIERIKQMQEQEPSGRKLLYDLAMQRQTAEAWRKYAMGE